MMRNRTLVGKILIGMGLILFNLGLILLGFYSDMNLFERTNKEIGTGVFILGVLCLIASNFFKLPRNKNY
ncbi:hypothetical protein [Bacillus bingmayongensis]|uniref:hypothetical protein n=1 Tax=Bacillus bingmayongensis TaxID=1150157 RepID=UPI000313997C|nr:hypothetical protein [Bacillus bingmayongensis]MBY0597305.1 hypothetical protein [Bacillus bingmayongensis]